MDIPFPVALFVDDEERNLRLYKRVFERLGYVVLTARHGQDALDTHAERFATGKVDVIVTDVTMSIMDGPTFVAELRQRFPNMTCPILFLTGSAGDPRLEGEIVLLKPMRPQELGQAIMSRLKPVPSIPPPRSPMPSEGGSGT